MGQTTILLETLGGTWESPGIDRQALRVPEQVSVNGNTGGFDTCQWTLRRALAQWPDLTAFTSCEIWEDGVLIFEGRVQETPMRRDVDDELITVSGRGWQYHMDDDAAIERSWVHSALTEWVDVRSMPDANLAAYKVSGQVEVGTGLITIGWPKDTSLTGSDDVGVLLRLPEPDIKRIVIPYETSANATAIFLQVIGYEYLGANAQTLYNTALTTAGASGTIRVTANPACRYLYVILAYGGATTVIGAQVYARLKAAKIFAATAYESADESVMKSSAPIKDALPFAPLLSQDTSQNDPNGELAFNWPDFHLPEPRTVREIGDAVNAAHRWQLKVGVGRQLIYRAQASVPKYSAPARVFEDASANSGEEIYNKCVVVGTGPDGQPLRVPRYAAQLPGVTREPISSPAPTNPSFATDLSGWTLFSNYGGGAFTRDTVVFDSSPASGKASLSMELHAYFTGSVFRKGVPYTLTMRVRMNAGTKGYGQVGLYFGVLETSVGPYDWGVGGSLPTPATWVTQSVTWIPKADRAASIVQLSLNMIDGGNVDSLSLASGLPTLVDRRGFTRSKRLDVSAPLIDVVANQFGDVFLQAHMKTPMRGSASIAPGDLKDFQTGALVHPRNLVIEGGELIHFADIVDPDTGGFGRDGMIASTQYDPSTEVVAVQLDNQRDNMESLLARYAVVVGGGR